MVISPVISVSMKWREVVGGHWVELGGHRRNNAHRNVAISHQFTTVWETKDEGAKGWGVREAHNIRGSELSATSQSPSCTSNFFKDSRVCCPGIYL